MEISSLEVTDQGNDVLLVRATVSGLDGVFEARGWVSALSNHFTVDDTGVREKNATGRTMSTVERDAYYEQLLLEQNPALADMSQSARPPTVLLVRHVEAIEQEAERTKGASAHEDVTEP